MPDQNAAVRELILSARKVTAESRALLAKVAADKTERDAYRDYCEAKRRRDA